MVGDRHFTGFWWRTPHSGGAIDTASCTSGTEA